MNRLLFLPLAAALAVTSASAVEQATYNSAGALTSLITDGAALPVTGTFQVTFSGGLRETLQPHDQKSPIVREGTTLSWHGYDTFPNTSQARFTAKWSEGADGVTFDGTATAGGPERRAPPPAPPLDLKSVDYVIDVPRDAFAGGTLQPGSAALPRTQPADPTFQRVVTDHLVMTDAAANWTLAVTLDQPRPVTVTDTWDEAGRNYRLRITLHSGPWEMGAAEHLHLRLKLTGHASAAAAHLSVSPGTALFPFDGFGGDLCWSTKSPATAFLLKNLQIAWARCALNAYAWDRERGHPGADLEADFAVMRQLQQRGIPWVLSLWRLPERYYADANQKPFGTFGRQIAPSKWSEFLDLLGSYLTYLKTHYGAEPDYFSFNEPDLGVDLGFTADAHRDTIKRLGAYFEKLGLKTKLLLGDTANPRDSHQYVLPTAADPAALRYVGAVSFHSWGNGTPEQYEAWRNVAHWLNRPLIVGEAGVDPSAWRNHCYDSYAYGLTEMLQYQQLLRYAQPASLLYWEFTDDYGLVSASADGKLTLTGRYWLMRHFTNLTPAHSQGVRTESDQPDVAISGFARAGEIAIHILNTGPAREATLVGLPPGAYDTTTTTETVDFDTQAGPTVKTVAPLILALPARSLSTLVRRP
ncbi:MAG TPA: hypothetical protein VHE61_21565 [Opitutaceae bacterium]|nr:hypothetical protein [Opitutaceae bacterium]